MQWIYTEATYPKIFLVVLIFLIAFILLIWWNKGNQSDNGLTDTESFSRERDHPNYSIVSRNNIDLAKSALTTCSQQFGSPLECMRLQSLEKSMDYPGFGENNFDVTLCSKHAVEIDDTQMTSIYMVRNQLKLNCFSSSVVFTYGTEKLHNAIYTFKNVNNAWSSVLAGVALVTVNGEQGIYTFKSKYNSKSGSLTLFLEDSSSEVVVFKGSIIVTLILTDCVSNLSTGVTGERDFNMITGGTNTMSRG